MKTPTLDALRTELRKPNIATAALATIVDQADKLAGAAAERLRLAASALEDNPLASAADRARHRDAAATARLESDDAAAILAEAQRQHAAATAAEEDRRRTTVYQAARAKAEAAAAMLTRDYPALIATAHALLKTLAEAQQSVAAANLELPHGASPLADPEHVARGTPGIPAEVVADEHVVLWGRYDLNEPVEERFQGEIESCGPNGWGKRRAYDAGYVSLGEPEPIYRKRRFHKVTTRDGVPASIPLPLAAALRLPALRGDRMAWGADHLAVDPGLSAAMSGEAEPAAVLARLASTEAQKAEPQVVPRRSERVEWVSHEDVVPLPAPEQRTDTTRSQPLAPPSRFRASPFSPGRAASGRR